MLRELRDGSPAHKRRPVVVPQPAPAVDAAQKANTLAPPPMASGSQQDDLRV